MPAFISEHPFTFAFFVTVVVLLLAGLRNPIVEAVAAILNFLASPFVALGQAIHRFLPHAVSWIHKGLQALRSSGHNGARADEGWSGWDIIQPLLWLGLFATLVVSEVYVADLRFAALLGVRPYLAFVSVPVDIFLAIMLVSVAAAFAFALPELRQESPTRAPWASLSARDRERLMRLCLGGLIVTFTATALLWFWGALQSGDQGGFGELEGGIANLFWILLAPALLGATALAGWVALASPAAAWVVTLMIFRGVLHLVELFVRVVVMILDKFAHLITTLIDVPARLGQSVLNAIGKHLPEGWRFEVEFIERPVIGKELSEPLDEKELEVAAPKVPQNEAPPAPKPSDVQEAPAYTAVESGEPTSSAPVPEPLAAAATPANVTGGNRANDSGSRRNGAGRKYRKVGGVSI